AHLQAAMMLRTNALKSRIADGQPAHGAISSIPISLLS
ncbi:hypothetical protein PSYPI_48425, partial [Pseudomonas syringae pv. pisi str. 1704B]